MFRFFLLGILLVLMTGQVNAQPSSLTKLRQEGGHTRDSFIKQFSERASADLLRQMGDYLYKTRSQSGKVGPPPPSVDAKPRPSMTTAAAPVAPADSSGSTSDLLNDYYTAFEPQIRPRYTREEFVNGLSGTADEHLLRGMEAALNEKSDSAATTPAPPTPEPAPLTHAAPPEVSPEVRFLNDYYTAFEPHISPRLTREEFVSGLSGISDAQLLSRMEADLSAATTPAPPTPEPAPLTHAAPPEVSPEVRFLNDYYTAFEPHISPRLTREEFVSGLSGISDAQLLSRMEADLSAATTPAPPTPEPAPPTHAAPPEVSPEVRFLNDFYTAFESQIKPKLTREEFISGLSGTADAQLLSRMKEELSAATTPAPPTTEPAPPQVNPTGKEPLHHFFSVYFDNFQEGLTSKGVTKDAFLKKLIQDKEVTPSFIEKMAEYLHRKKFPIYSREEFDKHFGLDLYRKKNENPGFFANIAGTYINSLVKSNPVAYGEDQGMEFVLIPAGEFMMGSENGDDEEKPVRRVRISRPFYLGKYEVTQGQWFQVMGSNPSHFKIDPNRPVENVSWDDVQEFIKRLHAREDREIYRLPTEAEWEYAARAGTTTDFHFGNDRSQLGKYAWYEDNAGGKTHPVGQLQPNAWGLHDMHGNVWEWVQDWFGSASSADEVTDPRGPQAGSDRVLRGGSWINGVRYCRSAQRSATTPGGRGAGLGFRLLRMAP